MFVASGLEGAHQPGLREGKDPIGTQGGSPAPRAKQDGRVDGEVHGENADSEEKLRIRRQAGRIDERRQIVLDEVSRITGAAGSFPQVILERRERADPTQELHECPPDRGREVQPGEPGPSQDKESAGGHEDHEGKVKQQDRVREDRVDHPSAAV
jgi:hypothetical protein